MPQKRQCGKQSAEQRTRQAAQDTSWGAVREGAAVLMGQQHWRDTQQTLESDVADIEAGPGLQRANRGGASQQAGTYQEHVRREREEAMFQQGGYVESEQLEAEAQRGETEKEGERK